MKYVVLFEDAPTAPSDLRRKHMAAHLAFLEAHADQVEAAGPLADPERQGRDGLWIVEAASVAAVDALIKADPFWPTGLRHTYSVIPWTQVFASGKRVLTAD
ncbi:MAG: YciI family protein [Pseudomonadota bacterium]